jgi:hypothetical protein
MERCILVRYTQTFLDILQNLLTYMFICCSCACRPTGADLSKVMYSSRVGAHLEDGTNVLCRNVVTLLPDHTTDIPKSLNFGTEHHVTEQLNA